MSGALFFAAARKPRLDAVAVLSSTLRDSDVKMNDVERVTALTISMLWPPVAHRVITRVDDTFAIETESDSE
jgi:hypothetical protein